MKSLYIIAFAVIGIAAGFLMWAFSSSMTPYVDVATALRSDTTVQVRGKILRKDALAPAPFYDPATQALRFWIEDDKKHRIEIYYRGAKPEAFDTAPETAATGRIRKGPEGVAIFESDSLVVKCPSKYDDRSTPYKKQAASAGAAS